MLIYVYKLVFILVFAFIGYNNPPFQGTKLQGAIIGGSFAFALSLLAVRIKKTELRNLWSATIGILGGAVVGFVVYILLEKVVLTFSAYIFFKTLFLFGFPITGLFIGIQKPNMFSPLNIREFFRGSSAFTDSFLLDTSAIIDGRVLPITLSGFIQGELIITNFVLAELQSIADSTDPTKKVRGRRGLDVIEKLRSNPQINVTILNKNIAGAKTVDQKIVLLAKDQNFKIVTNDINLSRIAKLQDVIVLNVNELAFALKPIVYPGEHLKVHITKAGKEKKQGIAYLEDGTMVVIDDAKSDIGRDLDVEVTSVLQTTSGKMIFGRKLTY
ncbi:MAG: TRAM domain-containing protein [Candidatus Aminicenantes bacterium]|nr:TRAM domain-containing protein [Candidatus Aminicenantes bacterium]NIM81670.1 TRAM domain-containing protein [Candidatus Aminicenantes bacterium]NIN21041.1 TRAM domain-containing protein [Candidatus Aminicenantes bacterium]NIN44863.1 TRAM domain-containing protein [Candidatus Aminicenantes bacterium]NIN87677.1 TRAM domain-containing protein [Candidatus Aminicenantes bacterium]